MRQLRNLRIAYRNKNTIILHKLNGTQVKNPWYLLKTEGGGFDINIQGTNNIVEISEPIVGGNLSIIQSDGIRVKIGKKARLYLNISNISGKSKNQVIIGDNFSCNNTNLFLDAENQHIIIRDNCLFSWGINIHTSDHHPITMNGEQINRPCSVTIEDHVWICSNAMLLKGSKISKNSVVGCSAVVTKPFNEPNVIIAGNPAKVVKTGIDWSYG